MLAVALWVPVLAAEPPDPAKVAVPFRITGIVVNGLDGSPVPRCRLTPSLVQQRRGPGRQFPAADGTDADEHGRFSISVPSAGAWHLTASAPGYVSQAYDQHENYSSAVVLTAAEPTIDLVFRLPPEAGIRGVVLDEAGEAVRNARVGLLVQQAQLPGEKVDPFHVQAFTQTDDRGMYEFANLPPGKYRVLVEAKPWYASGVQGRRFSPTANATVDPSPDPSLDVTYQLTWYPGVDDAEQAETITMHPGEDLRADFHLVPIPAIHLRIIPPVVESNNGGRPVPMFPMLERMDMGVMGIGLPQTSITNLSQGQIDVGGLAPGLYRIRIPEQNSEPRTAVIEVGAGSAHVVDFSAASTMVNITMHIDKGESDDRSFGVELRDAVTGQRFFPVAGNRPMSMNIRRGSSTPESQRAPSFQVPPGRYEVSLMGRGDSYLTGISAQGAEVLGRFVTVNGGNVTLTLYTASERATVNGIAALGGKPLVGAMVLLVPAGLDDPGSFAMVARDQTNTDGSVDLLNVIPGQYILIAIDHGWNVNWTDPSTLRSYLTQGIPLDIQSGAHVKQNIDAQAP